MVPDVALDRCDTDCGNIYVPVIDIVAFWHRVHDPRVDSIAVNDFDFGESDALFESGGCADSRDHHEFDELLRLDGKLPALCLFEAVFGGGDLFDSKRFEELFNMVSNTIGQDDSNEHHQGQTTYHLKLVLPKLLLPRFIEKWEISDMVNKDVTQDGQFGLLGRDFASFGSKWCAESL